MISPCQAFERNFFKVASCEHWLIGDITIWFNFEHLNVFNPRRLNGLLLWYTRLLTMVNILSMFEPYCKSFWKPWQPIIPTKRSQPTHKFCVIILVYVRFDTSRFDTNWSRFDLMLLCLLTIINFTKSINTSAPFKLNYRIVLKKQLVGTSQIHLKVVMVNMDLC